MAVYKESATNTWLVIYRYTDWRGERKQSSKRGFSTKREAIAWEIEQLNKVKADLDMSFESFVEIYSADMHNRLKVSTRETKEHIIRTKLLPYFGKRRISEIQPKDIIAWQNEIINYRDEKGNPYSQAYLKTVHNQISAIFNHAVRFYDLRKAHLWTHFVCPSKRAPPVGGEQSGTAFPRLASQAIYRKRGE